MEQYFNIYISSPYFPSPARREGRVRREGEEKACPERSRREKGDKK